MLRGSVVLVNENIWEIFALITVKKVVLKSFEEQCLIGLCAIYNFDSYPIHVFRP